MVIWQKFRQHKLGIIVLVLILSGLALRLFFIAHNYPATDSEEGTMGLEALHIASKGEHPIYLYGQNYMGVGEAYLGAGMFHLFGVSIFSLRLGMLLLFGLFLIASYFLATLLYDSKVALISLFLLAGGTESVLTPEMKAVGGAVETLVCGSTMMLLSSWLALRHNHQTAQAVGRSRWLDWIAYSTWGIVVGMGLWSHLLAMPFVFFSTIIVVLFCQRDLCTKASLFLLLGLSIGSLPLIIYNVTAPIKDNTLAVFIQLHQTTYANAPSGLWLWLKQFAGTFFYSLPMATDMLHLANQNVLPLYSSSQSLSPWITFLYSCWSAGYITLLASSTWLIFRLIGRLRSNKWSRQVEMEKKQWSLLVLLTCRLMLLLSAWATLIPYLSSATAAVRPWSFRYLIGLLISLPAIIAPLIPSKGNVTSVKLKMKTALSWGAVMLVLVVNVAGTLSNSSAFSQGDMRIQRQKELVQRLLQLGITRIYSGYWVCDRIIFQSQEKIICAALNEQMQPDLTRYAPYKNILDHSRNIAYVFTQNGDFHPQHAITVFTQDNRYQQIHINEYVVFMLRHTPKEGVSAQTQVLPRIAR
jgi:4-amino-4-deoxy-L-arabinose transferase-like glycosyltransferase